MSMRRILYAFGFLVLVSCQHNLLHERHIQNNSTQTITVINPDYDTTYFISPGASAMIYSYEILDKEQEGEVCKWQGDTLDIRNEDDSICTKVVVNEDNWSTTVKGPEKERVQKCTFTIDDSDF